jgi:hypothetical protein
MGEMGETGRRGNGKGGKGEVGERGRWGDREKGIARPNLFYYSLLDNILFCLSLIWTIPTCGRIVKEILSNRLS